MNKINELRARCDPKHTNALKALARAEGVKQSEALRLALREAVKRRGLWPVDQAREQIAV